MDTEYKEDAYLVSVEPKLDWNYHPQHKDTVAADSDGNVFWFNRNKKCWLVKSLTSRKRGSYTMVVNRQERAIARIAYECYTGKLLPSSIQVRTINGNPADFRKENLVKTRQSTVVNQKTAGGFVRFNPKTSKYDAYLVQNYKRILLGSHDTLSSARVALDNAKQAQAQQQQKDSA